MVAATKKGRPKSDRYTYAYKLRNMYDEEKSDRAVRNTVNANEFISLLMDRKRYDIDNFFSSSEGLIKHKGIAEQIGRMLFDGLISDDQAIEIATQCITDYYKLGKTSKEIEKSLRQKRKRG